jgi:hypothetical protein
MNLYVETMDRNAVAMDQLFARRIFDILDSGIPYLDTVLDATGFVGIYIFIYTYIHIYICLYTHISIYFICIFYIYLYIYLYI